MENKKQDTYSYKGWLVSDFFIKRAFAVLGHYLTAGLIIWAGIIGIILLLITIFSIVSIIIGI
ncbi:hypothetical protein K9L16_00785 [Candidatus Pacearchaeota archaeon]|nr:hypothetical protein [Candidatus Pacearchaeota archaeon]